MEYYRFGVMRMEIEILYCDKDIAVCIKPAGVLSESGGMPELLSAQLGGQFYCVHRLDKAVGGVMVYARSSFAAAKLSSAIAQGQTVKEYLAVVLGRPEPAEGLMRDLLFRDKAKNKSYVVDRMRRGVKEAELEYALIGSNAGYSLVQIRLHTGRSHQIRVQFASRGMPLLGDARYGGMKSVNIALWSHRLSFPDVHTGELREFTAPAPGKAPWNLEYI